MTGAGLPFIKAVGAGNDFIFLMAHDLSSMAITSSQVAAATARICDRHWGVGADGVIILHFSRQEPDKDIRWDFFNADGSVAEMCGNAARCVGTVLAETLNHAGPFRLLTSAGPVQLTMTGKGYRVSMPKISGYEETTQLVTNEEVLSTIFVNTGVPHLAIQLDGEPDYDKWRSFAAMLRRHPSLGTAGANVTFFWKKSLDRIGAVTFERGVENFTLACGTGAVAAAYAHVLTSNIRSVDIAMPGGVLNVEFDLNLTQGDLSGPSAIVFRGDIEWRSIDGKL
jgi:diaminopimelate epimerase